MSGRNRAARLLACVACVTAAGCTLLAPQPDRSRFYLLTPVAANAVSAASATSAPTLTIGLGPVSLPDYLRRAAVVTRVGPNRVELSDEKRWAEPLDLNFTRVLSENLATLLGTERIEKYPWPLASGIDYQVEVSVQRFETTSDGQSQLVASWIIRAGRGHQILYASKTTASAPAGADEVSASSALSDDLATLSRQIASRIAEEAQHRAPNNAPSNAAQVL